MGFNDGLPPPLMGEGEGGGGYSEFSPSPLSPPTKGGEIFWGFVNCYKNSQI